MKSTAGQNGKGEVFPHADNFQPNPLPRLVLWDFDGTLADTLQSAVEIYNRIAAKHKAIPIADPEAMRGSTSREILKRHRIRWHRLPFLLREFLNEQNRTIAEVKLHPGIAATLEALTRAGIRQGIVSSNSEANIRLCLEQNQAQQHFEFVVGLQRLSGKKRALRRALKLAGLDAQEVLYVGDEIRDIKAARGIRMPIACVTWGANSRRLLERYRPDHIITLPQQLLPLVAPPKIPFPESEMPDPDENRV